jgi:hypothetical protein
MRPAVAGGIRTRSGEGGEDQDHDGDVDDAEDSLQHKPGP